MLIRPSSEIETNAILTINIVLVRNVVKLFVFKFYNEAKKSKVKFMTRCVLILKSFN